MDEQNKISTMMHFTINKMTDDMGFVGLFYIIIGALYSLTIVGALFGIPMIISGLRLRESSDSFIGYLTSSDERMLEIALERQGRFFFIQKVLMIISIILLALYIFLIIMFGAYFFHSMNYGRIS